MAGKKTGLGRGLDALLGPMEPVAAGDVVSPEAPAEKTPRGDLRALPVDLLRRGQYQPRQDIQNESLDELAESIREQGVVQPIVVRPLKGRSPGGETEYEIVAGERRWRAAQIAGLAEIPVVIREISDSAAIAVALIENIQRENLNPLEEAIALRRLIEEFDMTHQQAAQAIGRSRAAVSNQLRLLDLCSEAKALVQSGDIEMGHARALLAVIDPFKQAEAARQVADRGLSVRDTERFVKAMQSAKPPRSAAARRIDPDVRRLQDDLSAKLGARVAVQQTGGGKGKLVISYNSNDELEGILAHIR